MAITACCGSPGTGATSADRVEEATCCRAILPWGGHNSLLRIKGACAAGSLPSAGGGRVLPGRSALDGHNSLLRMVVVGKDKKKKAIRLL
ncbi:hypothetical protein D3C85_994000 [compost metagenome]